MKELQPSSTHCFVCGVENRFGLHIRFYDVGPDEVRAAFSVPEQFQGYPGIVHGGVITAMLDEVASRVYFRGDPLRLVVTASLNIRYRKPVPVCTPLQLIGRGIEDKGRICKTRGSILSEDGTILAEADVTLVEVEAEFMDQYRTVDLQDWRVHPEDPPQNLEGA